MASWARRLPLLDFECRRFGFGIFLPFSLPFSLLQSALDRSTLPARRLQLSKSAPARVPIQQLAIALPSIQIDPAGGTEPAAIFPAQQFWREKQEDLFPDNVGKIDRAAIITSVDEILFSQFAFVLERLRFGARQVTEIDQLIAFALDGRQTPITNRLKRRDDSSRDSNLIQPPRQVERNERLLRAADVLVLGIEAGKPVFQAPALALELTYVNQHQTTLAGC